MSIAPAAQRALATDPAALGDRSDQRVERGVIYEPGRAHARFVTAEPRRVEHRAQFGVLCIARDVAAPRANTEKFVAPKPCAFEIKTATVFGVFSISGLGLQ